ncbi:DUF4230 domain-containing protein [Leptolyngbya sp. AN02str]|uniref:DUF4230 domain-containing protein n=1 Tax=Leptolyngbya sp. AN02str TaxID=3423363 RepID=UPI003D322834
MTSLDSNRNTPVANFLRKVSLLAMGGFMTAGLAVGVGLWQGGETFWVRLGQMVILAQPKPEVDIQALIIQQVRGASELTTAVYTMQAVVPAKRDRTLAGYTIGTTTLLYIAHGEVRAGVDLAQLTRNDVERVGDRLVLRLPAAKILDSKIDVNRSRVYDYDRGFLGLGPDVAPELHQLAQQQTLATVVQAACADGILQQANQRAELAVRQLLTTAGQANVVVEANPSQSAECTNTAEPGPPGLIELPASLESPPNPQPSVPNAAEPGLG